MIYKEEFPIIGEKVSELVTEKIRNQIKNRQYYTPVKQEDQRTVNRIFEQAENLIEEYELIRNKVPEEVKGLSGEIHFLNHILIFSDEATRVFTNYKSNNGSMPSDTRIETIDKELITNLKKGLKELKFFINTQLKTYLSSIRFLESEVYKEADVSDLKWFHLSIKSLKGFNIGNLNLDLKWFKLTCRSTVPNLVILVHFRLYIALCTILLSSPFIYMLWERKDSTVIDLSNSIIKLVAPGTLGLLGLVVTSATFIANFYKDKLQRYELPEKRNKLLRTIRTKNPEQIFQLTDDFITENEMVILDSLNAQNISKNLHKLSLYLILFITSSILFYMITFVPFNLNIVLLCIFLMLLILLFINILFTILFIIRIITRHLLFNDLPSKKYNRL
ncbi:hypothetical protein [Priestia megaterium]|uniref:hypothetical protein n=1 Tax=Priestia megaterium TaxID=1404 RepID=UPI002795F394|nr:hypothetical protein [Priestia megaterium]